MQYPQFLGSIHASGNEQNTQIKAWKKVTISHHDVMMTVSTFTAQDSSTTQSFKKSSITKMFGKLLTVLCDVHWNPFEVLALSLGNYLLRPLWKPLYELCWYYLLIRVFFVINITESFNYVRSHSENKKKYQTFLYIVFMVDYLFVLNRCYSVCERLYFENAF